MNQEQHTATPWAIEPDALDRVHGGEVIRPTTGNPSPIAVLCDFNRYDRDAERQANAHFIVKAVNSHEKLVSALDVIVKHFESLPKEQQETYPAAILDARAVLAEVQ